MTRSALLGYVSWLALCAPACSQMDRSPDPGSGADADECTVIQRRVATQIADVAHSSASRSCSSDQDCVTIALGASCFDSCTRSVSRSGAASVAAAIDHADAGECAAFVDQGCQLIHPPCLPPRTPTCNAGLCE